MGNPVTETLRGVADSTGAAEALYSVPPAQPWNLERMAATGASTATPELRVYRNGTLIDSTGNANTDTSTDNSLMLRVGDQIRAVWAKATPGVTMQLVIEGTGL